jgi:hypothetical protein
MPENAANLSASVTRILATKYPLGIFIALFP